MNFAIVSQDHAATAGGCDGSRAVDLDEPQLKEEILLLIANYLMENGFAASSHTLLDEAALKVRTLSKDRSNFRSMSKAVVAGNWAEVETLLKQVSSTNQGPKMKGLRYSVYRPPPLTITALLSILNISLAQVQAAVPRDGGQGREPKGVYVSAWKLETDAQHQQPRPARPHFHAHMQKRC